MITFATRRFQSLRVTFPIELSSIPWLLCTRTTDYFQSASQSHRATSALRRLCVQYLSQATVRKQINSQSQIRFYPSLVPLFPALFECVNDEWTRPYNTISGRQSAAFRYGYAIFTHFLPSQNITLSPQVHNMLRRIRWYDGLGIFIGSLIISLKNEFLASILLSIMPMWKKGLDFSYTEAH